MARSIFLFLIFLFPFSALGVPLADIAHDAEASSFYGDFFHAYRDYSDIEQENQKTFAKEGVEGYLRSVFILGDASTITTECSRLAASHDSFLVSKAAYLCGRHFVEEKDSPAAIKFLNLIHHSSNFYWPARILLATAYLVSNDPQSAVDALKESDLPQYKKWDLEDEFHLTLARTYAAQNKFDDSIRNYQIIDGKSPFYISALEESAWVFFKLRRFDSAQVLLDALIGNYESAQRLGNKDIPMFTYYRARYLRAYQALSEKRTEGAAAEFSALRNEYDKTLQKLRPTLKTDALLASIRDKNVKWTDVHNFPDSLKKQLDYISQWSGGDVAKKLENEIYFQMAVSRELARAEKFSGIYKSQAPGYVETLKNLQEKSWDSFENRYAGAVQRVARDMETIRIKAELGRLEIVWLKRADGARSLDEVIDNYKVEAHSIDEYMENDTD